LRRDESVAHDLEAATENCGKDEQPPRTTATRSPQCSARDGRFRKNAVEKPHDMLPALARCEPENY
jgi:hypothetical protein